ncbi:acyl-CoA carboxylase epsilon subunit [Brachybacterium paraconglomeratum]|uniref:acyl-CoA carboxylase epsilon subunit n=1 Tax=Brachybacterium paraconglomeratum TaxID=173362 RepID=UPI0021A8EABF|nr:hypothetical protein [Brachybacterium paraconglomeratum]MCT1909277.1 hypothetical protein [Brachybacterium paraconglomeratum]
MSAGTRTAASAAEAAQGAGASGSAVTPSDVRLVAGRLAPDELAAIAVVVSAMSVTSRLEAEERSLADGVGGASAWSSPVHTHVGGHTERMRPSSTCWTFTDR